MVGVVLEAPEPVREEAPFAPSRIGRPARSSSSRMQEMMMSRRCTAHALSVGLFAGLESS